MNIQILPNWCKKVGLIVFIIFAILSGRDDFVRGYNDGYNSSHSYKTVLDSEYNQNESASVNDTKVFLNYFGKPLMHLFDILTIVGMIIYMISREKIEDDYINKLRLDSFQLATLIILIVSIGLYAFFKDLKLSLDYFIMIFIWLYLIIFFIKKRIY